MDQLSMDIVRLCRRSRQGSIATQKNRQTGLTAMAAELKGMGFNIRAAHHFKPKHVEALVERWKTDDVAVATMRNRMAWLRWLAGKVNKSNIIKRNNEAYGLSRVQNRKPINKAQVLDRGKLAKIACPRVQAALMMQTMFGLRREEALKFQPGFGERSNKIVLRASWTKGRRYREIPVTTPAQRRVLSVVRGLAGSGSLVPAHLTYVEQLKIYERLTLEAGFRRNHGLRHRWAQWRYYQISGMKCPFQGGKIWQEMNAAERAKDRAARKQLAEELGHSRLSITNIYIGKAMA